MGQPFVKQRDEISIISEDFFELLLPQLNISQLLGDALKLTFELDANWVEIELSASFDLLVHATQ